MDFKKKKVKLQLIKTENSIRQKFRDLQRQRQGFDDSLNLMYKPILEPIRNIASNTTEIKTNSENTLRERKSTDEEKNYEHSNEGQESLNGMNTPDESLSYNENEAEEDSQLQPVQREQEVNFDDYKNIFGTQQHDSKYGVRYSTRDDSYTIGRTPVSFNSKNKIVIGKQRFTLSTGLLNLLFKSKPNEYSNDDLMNYKQIIELTQVHKRFYDTNATLKNDNSYKFKTIIKPLFNKQGKSLQTNFMRLNKSAHVDYKYWDDPNEMVDRLRLLIASQSAGHTGHGNEIIAIIEELREANIIE